MIGRHKRQGSDPIVANTVAVSLSPSHFNDSHASFDSSADSSRPWFNTMLQHLQHVMPQVDKEDAMHDEKTLLIYDGHSMADADIRQAEKELVEIATACKKQLQQRLAQEHMSLKQESEELYQQRLVVQKLQGQRDDLVDEITHLEDNARMLRQQIHQYQQDIQQTQQEIDTMEEDESKRWIRLQYEVSLFASATGVKFYSSRNGDDKSDRLLRGDVLVPSQKRTRRFSFDLGKESSFVVANKLWSMMSGDEDCFDSLLASSY